MAYLIGDVAAVTGLSVEGIRKYERAGIIAPERSDGGQYRLYGYLDVTCMIRCRAYRALGFSLREIAEMTNNEDIPAILERLQARENELSRENRLLSMQQQFLREKRELLSRLDDLLDRVEIREVPAFCRLEFAENGEITKSAEVRALCRKWMEYAPFVRISTRYRDGNTYGGLLIQEPYAALFPIEESPHVRRCPAGLSLRICVSEERTGYAAADGADILRRFAAEHRFRAEEDAFGQSLISVHKSSRYRRYRMISIGISY